MRERSAGSPARDERAPAGRRRPWLAPCCCAAAPHHAARGIPCSNRGRASHARVVVVARHTIGGIGGGGIRRGGSDRCVVPAGRLHVQGHARNDAPYADANAHRPRLEGTPSPTCCVLGSPGHRVRLWSPRARHGWLARSKSWRRLALARCGSLS